MSDRYRSLSDRMTHAMMRLAFRHPVGVITWSLVLAALSVAATARWLKWNANPDELASRGSQYLADYHKYVGEFGDIDCVHIVVASKGNDRRAEACVDRLEEELRRQKDLDGVYASVGPDEQLRIATRAMPIEDLARLRDSMGAFPAILSGEGPGRVLRDARRMLSDLPKLGLILSNEQQTQIGSSALFLVNAIAGAREGSEARQTLSGLLRDETNREYLRTEKGNLYFLRIIPHKDYSTLDVISAPLAGVRASIARVQREFPEVEIGLTGRQVLLCDQMQIASRDMAFATGLSVLLVYIAFAVMLRGFARPAIAVFCLCLGTSWTFGLTALAIGELTLISAAFTPILVGIGIEFGVHVLTRYQEERRQCAAELAMRRALGAVGRGNLTGAGATCAAFLTAALTNSPGFCQLGVIAGGGVILCMVALTVVLPAMVILYERWRGFHLESAQIGVLEIRIPNQRLGLRFLAACAIATAIVTPFLARVRFRDNVLDLQPKNLESVVWEKRVLEESSSTLFAAMVVDDLHDVPARVAKARSLPSVATVHSVLDAVAPPTDRRARLCADLASSETPSAPSPRQDWDAELVSSVARTLSSLVPFARVRSPKDAERMERLAVDLRELAKDASDPDEGKARQARADVEAFVARVGEAIRRILAGNRLPLRDALPESVRAMLMSPGGKFLVMVHPRENVWDLPTLERFVGQLRTVDPHVTGFPVTHLGTVGDLKQSFFLSAALALVAVTILVWNDLRSLRETALAITPLLVGLAWTLGWMGMRGIDLNLVNFISIPLLIGISVDSGVHILHRLREPKAAKEGLGTTTSAVVLTSMTSMFGFGSLMSSSHRGAQSLGLIMTVGCGLILMTSLTILPALDFLLRGSRGVDPPFVRKSRRAKAA